MPGLSGQLSSSARAPPTFRRCPALIGALNLKLVAVDEGISIYLSLSLYIYIYSYIHSYIHTHIVHHTFILCAPRPPPLDTLVVSKSH